MRSSLLEDGGGASSEASPCECEERLKELKNRLEVVALDPPLEALQIPPTLETHGDFLLKEMAWMAADFEVERKRHAILRKKRSKVVLFCFRSKHCFCLGDHSTF